MTMLPIDLSMLVQQCAPSVHPTTMQAVVHTESALNPYAIGVVGGHLVRQPRTREEAVSTVAALEAGGWNYSAGLAQVNRAHFARYKLLNGGVFDPCANLRAGSEILTDCYTRAALRAGPGQVALRRALSCYYSGNEQRGFKRENDGKSYVTRVVAARPADTTSTTGGIMRVALAQPTTEQAPAPNPQTTVPPIRVVREDAEPAKPSGKGKAKVQQQQEQAPSAKPRSGWDVFGDFGQTRENQ
ncbi:MULTISPECIES: lytic transglycosylase domain-containing protein [Burkholderia]|nr:MULTISPECIES: lytic transglycosylase domain-containing protein [Burkholderia]VWD32853.1 lytic transglycosylase [Burkholderia contaminans]